MTFNISNYFHVKNKVLLLSLLATSLLFVVLASQLTMAAPPPPRATVEGVDDINWDHYSVDRLPDDLHHLVLSTEHNDSSGDGNYTPGIKFLVYKKNGSGHNSFRFNAGNMDCSYFDIYKSTSVTDDTGGGYELTLTDTLGSDIYDLDCDDSNPNSILFTVDTRAYYPSQRFGSSYNVTMVQLRFKETIPNNTRAVSITRTTSNQRLSYWGDQNEIRRTQGTSSDDFPALDSAPSITPDNGSSSVSLEFAPPCYFSAQDVTIYWRDADSGTPANGGDAVTYMVREDGAPMLNSVKDAGDGTGVGAQTVRMKAGHKYRITFYNVNASTNNTIKVWSPFDQAGFYATECGGDNTCDDCSNTWKVGWQDNYVRLSGGAPIGTTAGSLATPEDPGSPQPGQTYEYVNDAKNIGDRSISNLRWSRVCVRTSDSGNGRCYNATGTSNDRWWSDSYKLVNPGYTNQNNFVDYEQNTQNIAFDRVVTVNGAITANSTIANIGSGVGANSYVGGPGWVWDNLAVTAASGGTTKCIDASFHPLSGTGTKTSGIGTTSWTVNDTRVNASKLCVAVPYYYTLEPAAAGAPPATVQQGENIVANGTVKNPLQTGTRQHTDSEIKDKGIVELIVPNGVAPPKGNALNPATFVSATKDPCQYMLTKASGSCSVRARDNTNSVTAGGAGISLSTTRSGANDDGSEAYDIGTKYCYATYTQHYKNTNSSDVGALGDDDYSYGPINCTAVVKKPKVQFLNTDVTVGKGISDGASCSVINGAPIITALAAGGNSLYGSWVEYGAFATGTISNFGSSAYPYGLPSSQTLSNRLLFGNYNGTSFVANGSQGDYDYNNKCLPETSQYVKDTDITKLNTNPAYSVTLPDGSEYPAYINATGQVRLDRLVKREDDKTGYVADGGKGIQFGVEPTDTSEDVGGGSAAVAGTYKVKQCTTNTNTPPDGWTFSSTPNQAGSHSGGCNDGGNYLKAWLAANIQNSDSSGWTFTAPANTTIKSLKADRIMKAAPAAAYRDTFAYLDAPGIHQGCTPFLGCTGATGNTTLFNNAAVSNVKFWVYCSVDAASSAIYYSDANIGCRNDAGETSYALSNIELTLNDGSVPSLNPSGSFRANTGKELTYTVSDTGSGVNKVDVVTKKADDATAPEISLYSAIPDSNGGKCDSSDAAVPVPCPLNVAKTVDIDTSALDDGVYDITMTATDKANNKDVKTWKYTVNNALPANTDAFKDRDIVLYSKKKDPNVPCNTGVNIGTGDIRIYQNIEFQQYGYNGISELPRLVLVADCNIIIHRSVDRVYASLVAGDAIKTCDVQSKSKDICQKALTIKGGISAKRLLLWRTANADLKAGDPTIPAESFNVSPSQIITKYNRGYRSSSATTANEVDLPPRY